MNLSTLPSTDLPPEIIGLRPLLSELDQPVHLVGGAVRDLMIGRASHDLDLIIPADAISLAFRIADSLKLPAYVLDDERDVGRVVFPDGETTIDIARYRGPDLQSDLYARDFTINAMAIPLNNSDEIRVIDYFGGLDHLAARSLQVIGSHSLKDDPLRTLRAVRFAQSLEMSMTADTEQSVIDNASGLWKVSPERKRDELVRLLLLNASHKSVGELNRLGLLAEILPEIAALAPVEQSAPHFEPVLDHTIRVLGWLAAIEAYLEGKTSSTVGEELLGSLDPYRTQLTEHLGRTADGGFNGRLLLRLGALFHDVGKSETQSITDEGKIRFLGHDKVGAAMAGRQLRRLGFSNEAINHVKRTVAGHMRPLSLANTGNRPSRRGIYRFYRSTGSAGLDIGLLSLADHLATYQGPGEAAEWSILTQVVSDLFAAYLTAREEVVTPPRLVSGSELMAVLDIPGGPEVGRLLALIEESQAAGEVQTAEQALALAQDNL